MSDSPNPYVSQNPYASPVEPSFMVPPGGQMPGGVWRRGNVLVMHKRAILPDRCVKTNQPTTYKLKRSLTWHHPAVYLAILANLIIYVILALALRKTAVIYIGLSEEAARKRKRNMLIAWLLVLAAIASFITAAVLSSPTSSDWVILGFIASPLLLLTGALWGLYGCRVVYPKRIDNDFVYLKGVCPEYLIQFPEA